MSEATAIMGKKKKSRKNGDTGKKTHKERIKERRERLEYEQQQPEEERHQTQGETSIEQYDRVWYGRQIIPLDDKVLKYARGTVERKEIHKSGNILNILPIDEKLEEKEVLIRKREDEVIKDTLEWSTRFLEGESVVISYIDENNRKYWLPAIVVATFAFDQGSRSIVPYICVDAWGNGNSKFVVREDNDAFIYDWPNELRFSVGNEVMFNLEKVEGLRRRNRYQQRKWMKGTVSAVKQLDQHGNYALYTCTFWSPKKETCSIILDNDEYICHVKSTPRERLFNAIESNCSYDHIDYLIATFQLDVTNFQDLVISKAIEYGSYEALLWLQEKASVVLDTIRDADGNGYLHQIVQGKKAFRFFESWEKALDMKREPKIATHRDHYEENGVWMENSHGHSVLRTIVANVDKRILSLLLARSKKLFGQFCLGYKMPDNDYYQAADGNTTKTEMLAEWTQACKMTMLHNSCRASCSAEQFKTIMDDLLQSEAEESVCRRFLRHLRQGEENGFEYVFSSVIHDAQEQILFWLLECEPELLHLRFFNMTCNEDCFEFAQPERINLEQERGVRQEMDLAMIVAHGKPDFMTMSSHKDFQSERRRYHKILKAFYKREPIDLSYILEQLKPAGTAVRKRHNEYRYLSYKIQLLTDDELLKSRVEILDYLSEKNLPPPNALDLIRWRQCGVLRWLVTKNLVNLEGLAHQETTIVEKKTTLTFLGSKSILPEAMTVKECLAFAAVEFDDLQTLQWLVGTQCLDLAVSMCNGWNILHTSAFYGRTEIAYWLLSSLNLEPLLLNCARRKPLDKCFCAHIAVDQGFVFLADLFLDWGCPVADAKGKSIVQMAKRSSRDYVLKWGDQKSRPISLRIDTEKLLHLISENPCDLKVIKELVVSSKCLQSVRWKEAGSERSDEIISGGISLLGVVKKCCLSASLALIEWILLDVVVVDIVDTANSGIWDLFFSPYDWFTRKQKEVDWPSLAEEMGCLELEEFQAIPWIRRVKIVDPFQLYPMFERLQSKFQLEPPVATVLQSARRTTFLLGLLKKFEYVCEQRLQRQLALGNALPSIKDTISVAQRVKAELLQRKRTLECSMFADDGSTIRADCPVDFNFWTSRVESNHPLRWQLPWRGFDPAEVEVFYLVAAAEGYDELYHWALSGAVTGWDASKEAAATRIAAYRGHTRLIKILLSGDGDFEFASSVRDRLQGAVLGSTEAGRLDDLEQCLVELDKHGGIQSDPFVGNHIDDQAPPKEEEQAAEVGNMSWICAAVYGCVAASADPNLPISVTLPSKAGEDLLLFVANKGGYSSDAFLLALHAILESAYDEKVLERGIDFLGFLCSKMNLNVWDCNDVIHKITQLYISHAVGGSTLEIANASLFLDFVLSLGFDLQSVGVSRTTSKEGASIVLKLEEIQAKQQEHWSRFDPLKHQAPLSSIQRAVEAGEMDCGWHDKQGLRLVHLAAAYNRADVLQWLIASELASLDERDGKGRTVLQIANSSNAQQIVQWIAARTITSFLLKVRQCREAKQWKSKAIKSVVKLQSWQRGISARWKHRPKLFANREEGQRFHEVWKKALSSVRIMHLRSNAATTWTMLKQKATDINSSHDVNESDLFDTIEVLGEAGKRTLVEPQDDEPVTPVGNETGDNHVVSYDAESTGQGTVEQARFDRILLTKEVTKWLRLGDSKYRRFFVRRIQQLACGDRSRILAKRLTGSKSTIYETYLEQKSGFRILWTERNGGLLIWYVAKHKSVSRLMELIDDAEERSSRQLTSASVLVDEEEESRPATNEEDFLMLDPRGNTPLKLYNVHARELDQLVDGWNPPLHLTESERDIVETLGSVLVLGRSGTGKTVCICNRMDFDRFQARDRRKFSQLFVATSSRLCTYVESAVQGTMSEEDESKAKFLTYRTLILWLEGEVRSRVQGTPHFLPSQYMDFRRFKREVWKPSVKVDPLIAWTSIRSFIKGSIEALKLKRPLSEEEYLNLGKKRCRIGREQRLAVYSLFEKYVTYCREDNLWDDCDRVSFLLLGLAKMESTHPTDYRELLFDKIYVDEVQDLVQTEIALFFRLSGPGGLFLAGDPAQSVVEGVEFRFEDIRAVGHYLYEHDRKYIPDKPKIVNINFRSHSGVLNVASGVLDLLFGAFPNSAKQLKKDRGLFAGPRPSVLHKVDVSNIKELISKVDGVVVIVHDEAVFNWKQRLDYPLIYGIREAKGLEFESVIILDFFRQLAAGLQEPVRDLFLGRKNTYDVAVACPEIEGLLKLLYTGTTRCIQRLLFAETIKSTSGDAFVRWATSGTSPLAIQQTVEDVQTMTRTPDEWLTLGLDNGSKAETEVGDAEEAMAWLEKAVFCFEKAGDVELARKARTHRSSLAIRSRMNAMKKGTDDHVDAFELELEVAREVENLLREHFLVEARCLVEPSLSFFSEYTQKRLQEEILSHLPFRQD